MSSWLVNALTIAFDPFEAAAHHNADFFKQKLMQARELVTDQDEIVLWEKAYFAAPRHSPEDHFENPKVRWGRSLYWAYIPALIFEVYEYGPGYYMLSEADKRFKTITQKSVEKLAEHATKTLSVPFAPEPQITTSWLHGFESGYRRRLEYALAYEASIKAESFDPFTKHLYPLIAGDIDSLQLSLRYAGATDSFSVLLNLQALLNNAIAYEVKKGDVHENLFAHVAYGRQKHFMLQALLLDAAAILSARLSSDGQLAIKALLDDLDWDYQHGVYNSCNFHQAWGQ